jgi:hypothetical protein
LVLEKRLSNGLSSLVKTRPPALITGRTPAVNYVFQVRALTESGYSDWSDSISRMAT